MLFDYYLKVCFVVVLFCLVCLGFYFVHVDCLICFGLLALRFVVYCYYHLVVFGDFILVSCEPFGLCLFDYCSLGLLGVQLLDY